MDIKNSVAISTGAASGMGFLFSKEWARLGGKVCLCDVNKDALDRAVSEINALYPESAIGSVCDVRHYEEVLSSRDAALSAFGRIDCLCNFAGGTAVRMQGVDREKHPEFPDVPISVYDWGIDVNLKGPFYFSHAVSSVMRKQKHGLIINIGSITGQEGDGYGMDYPTSKAGLMFGLTKSLAQFGAPYGIRAVCVSPGPVLTRAAMASMRTLVGRAADPQEIIDLIMFIASDKGEFINGENIMIDGGRNAMARDR
jgi:NAD(P)-dependent dehydrogenase (short-subunit alcohol dehydrogenase family)